MGNQINLFVSHYGGDEKYIDKFKEIANKKYDVRDSSIIESEPNNANNTEYIKSLIRPQIDWAGTVVVLIGPKTAERDWVNWEIEYAEKYGDKRIIGVYLPGSVDADIPQSLQEYGDACVAWDANKIIEALAGASIWQDSLGQTKPIYGTQRGTC